MKETVKLLVCCICAGVCICTSRNMPRAAGTGASSASTALTTAALTPAAQAGLKALPKSCLITGTFPAQPVPDPRLDIPLFNGHCRLHQIQPQGSSCPSPPCTSGGTKPWDSAIASCLGSASQERTVKQGFTSLHSIRMQGRKLQKKSQTKLPNNKTNRKEM